MESTGSATKTAQSTAESGVATDTPDPVLEDRTDQQLLAMFLDTGSSAAFAGLIQRHHAMIFSIARRMLGCPHAAEDVVQATFLVLVRDGRKIRKRHSLASWLFGVGYRISARSARQRVRTTVSTMDESVMSVDDPLKKLNEQFEQATVLDELHRLPETLKAPLVLRYLDGRTNLQVASDLGLSESAVEGRLKRGRKQLRLRLARNGITFAFAVGLLNLIQREAAALNAPHLVSDTLAIAMTGEHSYETTVESGISQEVSRMAEEEILKMATTKMMGLAGKVSLVVGVIASGLALAGNMFAESSGESNGDSAAIEINQAATEGESATGSGTIEISQAESDGESNADVSLFEAQESFLASTSTNTPGGAMQPEAGSATRESRRKAVGHYSIEELSDNELTILENLKMPVTFDYFETRLDDILAEVSADFGIQVVVDHLALSDQGISVEELFTFSVKNIQLDNALQLMFEEKQLVAILRNEVLFITSRDVAEEYMVTRVYNVQSNWMLGEDELRQTIYDSVEPDSWHENGGPGMISVVSGGLAIRASCDIHDKVNRLLAQFDQLYPAGD